MNIRLLPLTTVVLILLAGSTAGATTFTVSNTNDAGAGSLRRTIDSANADNTATSGSPHIINATGISGTISLQTVLPALQRPVNINGPGASSLTITRGVATAFRIFDVNSSVPIRITGVTITNGMTSGDGGGIRNAGVLTLINVILSGNSAAVGGAIRNQDGEVIVDSCTFSGNTAAIAGGGIDSRVDNGPATLSITHSTFSDNTVDKFGGGIANFGGTLTATNVTFSNDSAGFDGGGVYSDDGTATLTNCTFSGNSADDGAGHGGGIYSKEGTATLTNCTLSGNSAAVGGGIHNEDGEVTVDSSIFSDNTAAIAGGGIDSRVDNGVGTLTITSSTFSDNITGRYGGAIFNLQGTLRAINTIISGNSAELDGGGIYNQLGTATLTNCALSGNSADDNGGAVFVDEGTLTLINSTLSGNSASSEGGSISNNEGTIEMINSTLSNNDAGAFGGAIHNDGGPVTLTSGTIADNVAGIQGGGIYSINGTVSPRNTIIAGNDAIAGLDVNGVISSLGHNLIGNTSGSSGWVASDLQNVNPQLGPLQDNGGPTQTMAIGCISPALDAGDNTNPPTTDQRGEPRITDGDCDGTETIDIGAYEFQNNFPPTIVLTSSAIELSPVNHSYRTVNVSSFVTNVTEPDGACTNFSVSDVLITHVTSDEPEDANGGGDGNTLNDIVIASNCKSVQLRAERDGSGNGRVYRIHVRVVDGCGNADEQSFKVSVRKGNAAAVEGSVAYSETSSCSTTMPKLILPQPQLPESQPGISLLENHPNPFSTSTVIGYSIGTAGPVRLSVFDMSGRTVVTLVDEVQGTGAYRVLFNNGELPSGTYYYVLESNGEQFAGSMVLMR